MLFYVLLHYIFLTSGSLAYVYFIKKREELFGKIHDGLQETGAFEVLNPTLLAILSVVIVFAMVLAGPFLVPYIILKSTTEKKN